MVPLLLLFLSFIANTSSLAPRFQAASRRLVTIVSSSKLLQSDAELSSEIRKWHFLSHKIRPDDVYLSSSGIVEATTEIWKSVLVSLRVLEKNNEVDAHTSVIVFPQIPYTEGNLASLRHIADVVQDGLSSASSVFQPNMARKVSVLPYEGGGADKAKMLCCSVETRREKIVAVDYDDLDNFVPSAEDIVTNDIPGFPFDTIYDFISEINRPIDKVNMSLLRYKYSVQDLKYDVEKMKKKKDPQELVDNINCKLTRLATWRDALAAVGDGPDFFTEELDWSTKVKQKYRSMRALMLQADPGRLLDTQYDKKKTFIKIIDQWSDRLKRNFKFIYQSQREPVDFALQVTESNWRKELVETTKVLSKVPLLRLEGPYFEPGSPAPLFAEDRQLVWPANYQAEIALFETLSWLRGVDKVHAAVGRPVTSVSQLAFARGWVTESVLVDTWRSLLSWLHPQQSQQEQLLAISVPRSLLLDLDLAFDSSSARASFDEDHFSSYTQAVQKMNAFVRERSVQESKSVKEMFRDWIRLGREFVDWYTTLVRDLDLVDRMESLDLDRQEPWSVLIAGLLSDELESEEHEVNENVADVDGTLAAWRTYQPVLEYAEALQGTLPWRRDDGKTAAALAALRSLGDFREELVTVAIRHDDDEKEEEDAFVLVAPRYFRGTAVEEEYAAFQDFCALVERSVGAVLNNNNNNSGNNRGRGESRGVGVRVVPLHPKSADISRRAPHPALMFVKTTSIKQ